MNVDCSLLVRPLPAPWCDYETGDWEMVYFDPERGIGVRTMAVLDDDSIAYTYQTFQIPEAVQAVLDRNKAMQNDDNATRRARALSPLAQSASIPHLLHRQFTRELGPQHENEAAWKRRLNDIDYRHLRTDTRTV